MTPRASILTATLALGLALGAPPAAAQSIDLGTARLIDLSYSYDESTLYWPTAPSRFELETLAEGETEGGWFYSAYRIATPEHGGTHMDAPKHFHRAGDATDEVPLARLLGPAAVIDISAKAAADPDAMLMVEDILADEAKNGPIPAGSIVLVRTGWSARWPDARSYLGDDTPGDASGLHFPGYGAGAVQFLIDLRGATALGIDTASIDPGNRPRFPAHQVMAAANVPGFENLAALDQLPARGAVIVALPMKIAGGSGGPARVVALVPGDKSPPDAEPR